VPEPSVPENVRPADLEASARRELRALGRANAENVSRHLVMLQRLLVSDPELAYQHARYAASHAGRVAVVRESAGIAAYLAGHYADALREIRAARRSHIITGLPDTYGRGRIVGDYRRVALYGIDHLIAFKKEDLLNYGDGVMTDDVIQLREELSEQIRALEGMKAMAYEIYEQLGESVPEYIFLPVGISFFTFQSLSYTIDVYRGELQPLRRWIDYLFYVSFFPGLVAGPIVRARDFIPQMFRTPVVTRETLGEGLYLIICGLLKKSVISDYISVNFVDRIFDAPTLPERTTYRPEHSWSYELGGRYEDVSLGLRLEGSLYLMQVRDLQLTRFVSTGAGRIVGNAGGSRTLGVELSASKRLLGSLSAQASYSLTDARFTEETGRAKKGNLVPFIPQHTFSGMLSFNEHVGGKFRLFGEGECMGFGRIYWTEDNSTSEPLQTNLRARLGVSYDRLSLALWGNNLADRSYTIFSAASPMPNGAMVQTSAPRTLGVDLSIRL